MYGKLLEHEQCFWEGVFDNKEKKTLITGWVLSGRIGFFLVIWLNLNLWCTNLRHNLKYRNLAAFTMIMCVRRGWNYAFYFFKYMDYDWYLDIHKCSTYGFTDTFFGIFEVESLTHVCIERYVVAKYIANGWQIKRWHYILYPWLCLFFSLLYSLAPWFGIGTYVKDVSCLTCSYNMILPDSWEKYVVITIFLLRSAKPLLFMMIMNHWKQQMEAKYDSKNIPWNEVRFSHVVDIVTVVSISCWVPITIIRGLIIIVYNFLNIDMNLEPFVGYIRWAIWIEWFTPAAVTIALLYKDRLLRAKMLGSDKNEEQIAKLFEQSC